MAPSSLKFEGDKESWSRFKRAFLAWCTAQGLDKFLLNPLPALAADGAAAGDAGGDAAKAAEDAAKAAGASAVKKEKLDHAADARAACDRPPYGPGIMHTSL